jgi:hypothetical protein
VRREHPGQFIRRNILDKHGLSIGDTARLLAVPTRTLLDLLTGKTALSPELAERVEAVFGGAQRTGRRATLRRSNGLGFGSDRAHHCRQNRYTLAAVNPP